MKFFRISVNLFRPGARLGKPESEGLWFPRSLRFKGVSSRVCGEEVSSSSECSRTTVGALGMRTLPIYFPYSLTWGSRSERSSLISG